MKTKNILKAMLVVLSLGLPLAVSAGSNDAKVGPLSITERDSLPHNDPPCTLTLPYSTGFESDVSNQAPSCWTTLLGEAYTFNFVYYAHNGNQILALNSASGEARIATPRIPLPLNQVGVTLWYVDLALSTSGLMKVGFATSLTGTVQWIDTIPSYYDYTYIDLDFSHLSITDTGYLIFSYTNSANVGSGLVDDMTIFRRSICPPVSGLWLSDVTNHEATLAWSESSDAVGYHCYISATNSRAAAFDSGFVAAGSSSHTFRSLNGNTRYYVWVMTDCGDDYSTEVASSFVTNPDCGTIRNLHAESDYRSMVLRWDAPVAGDSVTAYKVEYKSSADSLWAADTVYDHFCFISGLMPDTRYDYRVVTFCSDSVSTAFTGSVFTLACSTWVVDSAATHASIPVRYSSANSYTQQIYLSSELAGMDTLTGITFLLSDFYQIDTTPIVLYVGNTSKTQFNSSTDFVPPTRLTQVFTGNVTNAGREVTIHFATPFVRNADSNLIVAVDNNLDDFASTTPSFVVGNGSYRAIYSTSLSDVDPAAPTYGTRINYVNRIKISTRGCVLPLCDRPMPCVSEVGDDYIDIVWNDDPSTLYSCSYRIAGTTTWIVADSNVTGPAYHFGDLEAGYDYEVRVARICDTDTLAGTLVVPIPCGPVPLPYTEDFERYVLLSHYTRSCWNTGTLSTNYFRHYPTVTLVNGSSSNNKVCQMTEGYLVLPRASRPLNELQLRFDLFQTYDDDILVLGLLRQMDDTIISAMVIDTFSYNPLRPGAEGEDTSFVYQLTHLDTTDGHLVFYAPLGCGDQYIDNIVLEAIPNCAPIEQCQVASVTTNSALLRWSETRGLLQATAYLVEYGSRFYTPGTGIRQTSFDTAFTLTGLNHSSDYDVYIYSICGSDTAIAFGPVQFSTLCGTVNTLPYSMDFEGIRQPGETRPLLPTCWYGGSGRPGISSTLLQTTDTTRASSGNYCLQISSEGVVALPLFDVGISDLKVQMHLYRTRPDISSLVIGTVDSVTEGFASSFTPFDTVPFDTTNESFVTFYLTDYTGSASRLALRTFGPSYAIHYIDDLTVDLIRECVAPGHVAVTARTATSATLSWRVSQAASYRVEYGVQGFAPGTGTTVTTNTQGITLSGLLPATSYDVRITGLCDSSESETTLFTFRTMSGVPVSHFPYTCTFADSVECASWEFENGTQANKWCIGRAAFATAADVTDSMSLYISNDSGATHAYTLNQITHAYAYRAFNMSHTMYHIHYEWKARGENRYDFLRVFLVPAGVSFTPGYNPSGPNTTSSFTQTVPSGWIALDSATALNGFWPWQSFDTDFEIPEPGEYNLLFYWLNDGSGGNQPPAAVDNITIARRGCPIVGDLTCSQLSNSTVTLRWQSTPAALGYIVEYGPAGFAYGSGLTDTVYTNSHTVRGLLPETAYDFYVVAICEEGWNSDHAASLLGVTTSSSDGFTVTLLANNDAYGRVEGGGTYPAGTVATLSAIPYEGYYLVKWDDENADNPRQYTVVADVTLTAIFASNTGIADPDNERTFDLYPNPATNSVTITCGHAATVVIVDLYGREVLRHRLDPAAPTSLPVGHLTPGVYFVRLADVLTNPVRKLLVK